MSFNSKVVSDTAAPWTAAHQDSLSFTISWSLLKLMSIKSVMSPNHLILCHPLLLLPSVFPSNRVLSNDSALHIRRPKYWSFIFSVSPSSEYSGLISFRMDWFVLLANQGTLKRPSFRAQLLLQLNPGPEPQLSLLLKMMQAFHMLLRRPSGFTFIFLTIS